MLIVCRIFTYRILFYRVIFYCFHIFICCILFIVLFLFLYFIRRIFISFLLSIRLKAHSFWLKIRPKLAQDEAHHSKPAAQAAIDPVVAPNYQTQGRPRPVGIFFSLSRTWPAPPAIFFSFPRETLAPSVLISFFSPRKPSP